MDLIEDTLDDKYFADKILQDIRDYTAALDVDIDVPVDRGDLHSEVPRGGVSPGNGLPGRATPE